MYINSCSHQLPIIFEFTYIHTCTHPYFYTTRKEKKRKEKKIVPPRNNYRPHHRRFKIRYPTTGCGPAAPPGLPHACMASYT